MRKRLTKKQRGFIRDYEATGNATLAARLNYNVANDVVAGAIGYENLNKPLITSALEKNSQEEEIDRKWVLRGTKQLAEQREEKSVALGAYRLIAQIIRIIDSNAAQPADLYTNNAARAEQTRASIEALTQLVSLPGSRFALFIESGNSGIQPNNGETAQTNSGVHSNME